MKSSLNKFELALINSLRKEGIIISLDSNDLERYLKRNKKDGIPPLPDSLDDAQAILKRGYIDKTYATEVNSNTTDDMARAAREGKSLPQNILDKMKADRLNSKKK